ncbi:S8 family serine peptidase [Nonomuraea ferruginea]
MLNDNGEGMESWIIEGMEWAARSGAKAVSMSLGGTPTDGTDPLSQAVDDLTAETGALFVVAAGNLYNEETVSAPGAADAALTVAAVDKDDQLAPFSSRGPRVGDSGLKPDIAAPGVNIVAARAAGTAMGAPVDEHYTGANGTSMATPHVAGAVAIMAQRHPDWTAQQLKAALMSTAKDDGFTVYEQGAGRLDLDRATGQRVFTTGGGVDFGLLEGSGEPKTGEVSYTNLGDQPVTLALKAEMSGGAKVGVADATLTIPAGGTAGTTVTLDPAGLELGKYSGAVIAEADGVRLTTPMGAVRDVPKFDLTIRTLDRDGKPRTPTAMSVVDVDGTKGELGPHRVHDVGVIVTRVPAGTVSVLQVLDWVDGDDRANRGWLFEPELTVTGDTEITLDAREASQIRFTTPKTAEPLNNSYEVFFQRTLPSGQIYGGTLLNGAPVGAWEKVWALPTKKVTKGAFRFTGQWELGVPEVTMTARTPKRLSLNPVSRVHVLDRAELHPGYVPFEGTRDLRVVDAKQGRPEDLAGKDLRGALVLIDAEPAEGSLGPQCGLQIERVGPIRDAGAAGILAFNERLGLLPDPAGPRAEAVQRAAAAGQPADRVRVPRRGREGARGGPPGPGHHPGGGHAAHPVLLRVQAVRGRPDPGLHALQGHRPPAPPRRLRHARRAVQEGLGMAEHVAHRRRDLHGHRHGRGELVTAAAAAQAPVGLAAGPYDRALDGHVGPDHARSGGGDRGVALPRRRLRQAGTDDATVVHHPEHAGRRDRLGEGVQARRPEGRPAGEAGGRGAVRDLRARRQPLGDPVHGQRGRGAA